MNLFNISKLALTLTENVVVNPINKFKWLTKQVSYYPPVHFIITIMTQDAAPQLPVRMSRDSLYQLICDLFLKENNNVDDIARFLKVPSEFIQYVIRMRVHNDSYCPPTTKPRSNAPDDDFFG